MGQQQLLLVILVVILVGIATVVAINVFGSAAEDANRDAVRQDLLQAASGAQAVWTRPEALGGAGGDFTGGEGDAANYPIEDVMGGLGIPGSQDDNVITNENGVYTLTISGASKLTIDAVPTSYPDDLQMIVCRSDNEGWLYDIADDDGDATDPCP